MMKTPLPEIHEAESSDAKEVFAFFGLAAYYSQVLEQELINIAGVAQLLHKGPSRELASELYDLLEEKTFGRLLAAVRAHVEIPSEVDALLAEALKARNYLAHRFFAEHSEHFVVEVGRAMMIEKLRTFAGEFVAADRRLDEVCDPYFRRLGITSEVVAEEMAKMMSNAERLGGR